MEKSCNRFDYVKYDREAQVKQGALKLLMQRVEEYAAEFLPEGRAKALFFTKLEEAYMWGGKAIRDEQVKERGAELQEERGNE